MRDGYPCYLFHQGTNFCAYTFMGVHRTEKDRFVFRVWAPHADSVYVIGSFNNWDMSCGMVRISGQGIWECECTASAGDMYKFRIVNGEKVTDKADPYALFCEMPPGTASVICETGGFVWHDDNWMKQRSCLMSPENYFSQPLNIYELHMGSFMHHDDGSYYSYTDLADELAPYVKQMGYTHVELMPVMEHPFAPSWGYQVCGYYAPSARFGTPYDFMTFIEKMHCAGIGVILDWVPAHFPKDAHGLYEFDGQPLYEFQGKDKMEHKEWGTRKFDVGRNEVQSFLISNAAFWADVYHADGLRVDAVSSMLYLDYGKSEGEWLPNVYGDNRCLESIAFFKKLNGYMRKKFPDVMMIAEESSPFPNVTGFENDGLGFSYKWNMGWMHDALHYISKDPVYRRYEHDKLTFSLTYAFSEKYILPLSHDEVVHGKKSLIGKMYGDYAQKFASYRLFMLYMITHPGKKLSFMGNETGQFDEWNDADQIEWFLLDYEAHSDFQLFCAELNHIYLSHSELWNDSGWDGFSWINADDRENSVYSYRRTGKNKKELITVLNFTPVLRRGYKVGVGRGGNYCELINTDDVRYGGNGVTGKKTIKARRLKTDGCGYCLELDLPPLGGIILKHDSGSKGGRQVKYV